MATPRKIIRDYRYEPEKALAVRKAIIAEQQARLKDDPAIIADGGRRVIPPYYPREPIPAGDPLSPSGTKVELSELADDVLDAFAAGGIQILWDSDGPADFVEGAYQEILPFGSAFPDQVIWWTDDTTTKKIIEKLITRNTNQTPSIIVWKLYDDDGVTVIRTVTDTISYQGVFETTRTRVVT